MRYKYSIYFDSIAKEIPIIKLLYYLSNPLTWICLKLNLSPNAVTSISNILTLFSGIILITSDSIFLFPSIFIIAVLLDLSDGVIARIHSLSTPNGAYYDFVSDRVKIIFIIFCIGIKYSSPVTWVIVFWSNSIILFIEFLASELRIKEKLTQGTNNYNLETVVPNSLLNKTIYILKSHIKKRTFIKKILRFIITALISLDINTMLFFLFVDTNELVAQTILLYLIMITIFPLLKIVKQTRIINARQ